MESERLFVGFIFRKMRLQSIDDAIHSTYVSPVIITVLHVLSDDDIIYFRRNDHDGDSSNIRRFIDLFTSLKVRKRSSTLWTGAKQAGGLSVFS